MPLPLLPLAIGAGALGLGAGLYSGFGSPDTSGQNPNQSQGNFLTGYPAQNNQVPRFNQGQQQLLQDIIQRLQQNPADFEGIANKARSDFKTDTIPSILQQFSASGSNKNSSGLQSALGAAGSQLDTGLASLRSQFGLQNQGQLLSAAFQPSFDTARTPATSGFLGDLFSNPEFQKGISSKLGNYFSSNPTEGAASTLAKSVGQGAATSAAGSALGGLGIGALGAGAGAGGLGLLLAYLINQNR